MSIQFRNSRMNRTYLSKVAGDAFAKRDVPEENVVNGNGHHPEPAVQNHNRTGAFAGTRVIANRSILEACHPDIVRAISLLWGYPEMNEYFDRLWMADDANGPIDPEAMSELMLLSRVHQMIVPQRPNRTLASIYGSNRMFEAPAVARDPWGDIPPRR